MPRTRTPRIAIALLVLGLLFAAQQGGRIPGGGLFAAALQNSLHSAWFFLVTLAVWLLLRLWRRLPDTRALALCALICLPIALLSEALQFFTERDASVGDLVLDSLGAGAAFALLSAWLSWRRRRAGTAVLGLGACALLLLLGFSPVWQVLWFFHERESQAPLLVDFDRLSPPLARQVRGRWEPVAAPPEWREQAGSRVAQVQLSPRAQWPGLRLREPLPDWSGQHWLVLEAWLPDDEPLPLFVRVETERDSGQASTVELALQPGANRLRLPLERLVPDPAGLPLIRNLHIFTSRLQGGREFYLAGVGLE